jgi:hypothetical protein
MKPTKKEMERVMANLVETSRLDYLTCNYPDKSKTKILLKKKYTTLKHIRAFVRDHYRPSKLFWSQAEIRIAQLKKKRRDEKRRTNV